MSPPRPFNPEALRPYAFPWLVPNVGNWSAVWRYTVLLPMEQVLPDGNVKPVASKQDEHDLHYAGVIGCHVGTGFYQG